MDEKIKELQLLISTAKQSDTLTPEAKDALDSAEELLDVSPSEDELLEEFRKLINIRPIPQDRSRMIRESVADSFLAVLSGREANLNELENFHELVERFNTKATGNPATKQDK